MHFPQEGYLPSHCPTGQYDQQADVSEYGNPYLRLHRTTRLARLRDPLPHWDHFFRRAAHSADVTMKTPGVAGNG